MKPENEISVRTRSHFLNFPLAFVERIGHNLWRLVPTRDRVARFSAWKCRVPSRPKTVRRIHSQSRTDALPYFHSRRCGIDWESRRPGGSESSLLLRCCRNGRVAAAGGASRPREPRIASGWLWFRHGRRELGPLDRDNHVAEIIARKMRIRCGRIFVVVWCKIIERTKSQVSNPRIQFG